MFNRPRRTRNPGIELEFGDSGRPITSKYTISYDHSRGGYTVIFSSEVVDLIPTSYEKFEMLDAFEFKSEERRNVEKEICRDLQENEWLSTSPTEYNQPYVQRRRMVETEKNPPPYGVFSLSSDNLGPLLKPLPLTMDDYVPLKQKEGQKVKSDLENFINKKEMYEEEGYKHSERLLLHGPPGNGKTMEIFNVLSHAEEDEFIAIFIPSSISIELAQEFRKSLEGENVVFVIEELTERTRDVKEMEEILSFLDGETSWNNSFVIATTNYPEQLPPNIVDRPGRFNSIVEFGSPSKEEKKTYLKSKGDFTEEDLERIVNASSGMSFDYLAQAIKLYKLYGKDPEEYFEESLKSRQNLQSLQKRKGQMGI